MPDYQLGKIYKVVNDVNGMVYIGSTAQPTLARRMTCHRSRHKHNSCKTYKTWGDITDCKIVLIEKFPCESKDELCARERYYIETICCVNKVLPGQTKKEWREKNKEHIKKYNEDNKDYKKEYGKDYRENKKEIINKKYNCECGGRYTYQNKTQHFKSEKHKDYLKSQSNIEDGLWIDPPTEAKEAQSKNSK